MQRGLGLLVYRSHVDEVVAEEAGVEVPSDKCLEGEVLRVGWAMALEMCGSRCNEEA